MKANLNKGILALAFVFVGSLAFANNEIERFDVWLNILQKSTEGAKNGEKAVEKLKDNPQSRIAAFNLQALGKLYGAVSPDFDMLKKEFKKIEDGLGTIDKWNSIGNDKNKEKATKKFAQLLEKEHWIDEGKSSKINQIRNDLQSALKNLKNSDDKLIAQLDAQLEHIESTSFDFSILEAGNGLHEYRRQIRWFMIESQVLNGLITFNKEQKSCPIEEYEELLSLPIAESKYSTLASNPGLKKTCEITQCYFVAMSDAVEKLGKLKDKAEMAIGNTTSDQTPTELIAEAQKISDQIHSTRLIKKLRSEIANCL